MGNQNNVIVSICCCTYNHEPYIRECLEGFVMQKTNFVFEILVHDDASTDKTANIVREYEAKYPQLFRCVYQTINQFKIQNTLTNILFAMARGKYIAICEGDDYWTDPNKLQKQVDFLEANEDFAICGHKARMQYELDTKYKEEYLGADEGVYDIHDLIQQNFIPTVSSVMRKEYIEHFPDWFYNVPLGDWSLFMLAASKGKIKMFGGVMAVRRVHSGGIWEGVENEIKTKYVLKTLNAFEKNFSYEYLPLIQEHKRRCFARLAYFALLNNNFDAFDEYIKLSNADCAGEHQLLYNNLSKKLHNQNSEIASLQQIIHAYKTSKSYRIGNFFIKFLRYFKK